MHNAGIERAAYFARKRNLINVFFVKRAWAWTMALYLLHLFTTPVRPAHTPSETAVPGRVNPALHVASPHTRGSRAQRLAVLVLASLAWILFTSWCFGAGLGDRIIAASGGQCSVPLPRGIGVTDLAPLLAGCPADKPPTECPAIPDPDGAFSLDRLASAGEVLYLPLPEKYCLRVPLSPTTHPLLFGAMKATHHLHEDVHAALRLPPPRWSGGFDISGHAFLLSLASLILAAEVAPSWKAYRARGYRQRVGAPARLHAAATLLATMLIGLWVWMLFMTAVYFHDPQEKFAGLGKRCYSLVLLTPALGFVTAAIVHLVRPQHTGPVIEFKVRGPTRRPSPAPIPHAEPVHPFDASEVEREKSQ